MLKVIIVDDEPYVRQMIKNLIRWDDLSLEWAGEFFNGEDAYNRIISPDSAIDLVITDLKMPTMDGLELIRKSLYLRKDLNFIVISAYDDFHLVKEAFMLGAKDYLLKSEMTADQIFNVLTKLQINKNPQSSEAGLALKQNLFSQEIEVQASNELMKENILNRLVTGNIHASDVSTLKELLCKNEKKKMALMILKLIKLDIHASVPEASFKNEISMYLAQTDEMLVYGTEMHYEIVQTSPFEYFLLMLYSGQESASSVTNHLNRLYDQFRPQGFCTNWGVSRISSDFTNLPQLIHEARVSITYCFVVGNGSIVQYTPRFDETPPLPLDAMKQVSCLKKLLNSILSNSSKTDINEIIVTPRSVCANHIHAIMDLYMKYHFVMIDFALQNGLFDEIHTLSEEYEKYLKFHGDLDSLNRWLASVLNKIKAQKGENSIIQQVKYYVENHYMQDISLQSVANIFEINSSYLSRLFSEKENTNFVDYLAHIRITRAIELIKTSNFKIYEICEKVGYLSPEHFSRTFKKITGKSPKQFMDGRE